MSSPAPDDRAGGRRGRPAARRRADVVAVEQALAPTREKARVLILAGEVWCGERRVDKPADLLPADAVLVLRPRRPRFVGRGGEKLDGALARLGVDPRGALVWDIGASTGGFTDCLLRRGAARVVAVDVGRGQLDASLRADPRVDLREGLNARHLRPGDLPGPPALVVIDVSFISLAKIVPAAAAAAPGAEVVALVKPQFEVGRGRVGRGGVVRDPTLQEEALRDVCARSEEWGLRATAIVESPLRGAQGNREFFVRWTPAASGPAGTLDVARAIREAVHGGG
jgi:23S rRNA (cytidine1920-2'-O)/16S rRNA (cytidine1409-2'-O)-methyltransferase